MSMPRIARLVATGALVFSLTGCSTLSHAVEFVASAALTKVSHSIAVTSARNLADAIDTAAGDADVAPAALPAKDLEQLFSTLGEGLDAHIDDNGEITVTYLAGTENSAQAVIELADEPGGTSTVH